MLNVLIVDNHEVVRNGMKTILLKSKEGTHVGEAVDGHEVLEKLQSESWDLVFLDIGLPDEKGTEVLKKLKKNWPDLPVVMFSLYSDRFTVVNCLRAGAAGYLSKEAVATELIPAIEAVMAGNRYVSPALIEKYDLKV